MKTQLVWFVMIVVLGRRRPFWIEARDGMTIDKLECEGNAAICLGIHCSCHIAPDNPFDTKFSFGFNLTRTCPSVFVRLTNYVKVNKGPFTPSNFKPTVDVCAIATGGKHPVIKAFMGPNIYEEFDKYLHPCPYGPEVVNVQNFSVDGTQRGMFGIKKTGVYRSEFEFTCGKNLKIFTLKIFGKRALHINGTDSNF